jgi:ribonuclease HI
MPSIVIFTDGACTGNPGPGGWASIIAFPNGRVRELGGGERQTTNNRMEMSAALEALQAISDGDNANVIIYTDSTYLIKGITQWIWGWRSKGWKNAEGKDVANRDLWEDLAHQMTRLKPSTIEWKYVRGHAGIPGNERCDEIAVAFSKGYPIDLYDGEIGGYTVDITQIPQAEDMPAKKTGTSSSGSKSGSKSSGGGGPVSYLSYVGGVVMRHASWAGCERRVKGQSNAKFRKAKSQQEEREILSSWGVDPTSSVIET